MVFRTLVTNYLREQAQERLLAAVRESGTLPQGEGADAQPPPPCDVAIVFAVPVEAGGLVDLLENAVTLRCASFVEHLGTLGQRRVVLVEAGVGAAAGRATLEAISLHHAKWVIAAGFATGLDPALKRGHFLIADEVTDLHGQQLAVDLHVRRESLDQPTLHGGRLLTIDHLLRSPEEKFRLGHNHAAQAADMETLAIAHACRQRNVRFLAVRIITDTVEDALPAEVERMLDQKSLAAKLGAAAGALWKHPATIKDMWQLKEDAVRASDRLARLLVGVVGNLPLSQ
jgi:adenosylhomocysteine nucleosidase